MHSIRSSAASLLKTSPWTCSSPATAPRRRHVSRRFWRAWTCGPSTQEGSRWPTSLNKPASSWWAWHATAPASTSPWAPSRAGARGGPAPARPGAGPGRHRPAARHDPGSGRAGRRGLARQPGAAPGRHPPVSVPHHPGGRHQRGPPRQHGPVPGLDRPAGRAAVHRGHRQRVRRQRGRYRLRDHRHARTRRAARRRLPRRRPAASARAGPMTIQVILADDQPLIRAGLRRMIEQTPDIDVAGEAGTGGEAVQLARDTDADVVVMDSRMPGMDGIEATQMITAGDTRAHVLMLTTFDDDDYVYGALRAGASGFLVKDMALDDILTAIRVVAAGDAIIAPGVTSRLIAPFHGQPQPGRTPREITGITDREREVLRLVGLGMSNAEIAASLYITAGTAKTHVARLLAKLGARDRVQLVITAYQAGLVDT